MTLVMAIDKKSVENMEQETEIEKNIVVCENKQI